MKLWIAIALLGIAFGLASRAQAAEPAVNFGRQIQPILAKRCFACHGPDKHEGGLRLDEQQGALAELESGERAIVPGKLEASALVARIASTDDELRMPPEGPPLSAAQIEQLRKWIADGAAWDEHWAFRAPQPPTPPAVKNTAWTTNPIDAFILSRLEHEGLTPAAPADRIALARRVYYDLTGLPPSPTEVDAFVSDQGPDAYEKLVDRLLASPHYGEHWARHWLDVVRYADTNSFERDGNKPHSWRYRDYVIRALNDDKPYDQFIREQLAGDELSDANTDSIIATGFYRLGLWDDEPADRLQAKYDGLDDIVATTSQVFLGLTLNCARCHDHKIDPIPQKDYYSLLAFFHNVAPMNGGGPGIETRIFTSPDGEAGYQRLVRELDERRNAAQSELTKVEETFRTKYEEAQRAGNPLDELDAAQAAGGDLDELEFRFYRDSWDRLPDFDNLKAETTGKAPRPLFDIGLATRPTDFGFVFVGFLKVPQDGEYTFSLDSDDGSRLIVGGKKVNEYDGPHGLGEPKLSTAVLKQGRVPIRLEYFQRGSGKGLVVRWKGPGVKERLLSVTDQDTVDFRELLKTQGAKILGQARFDEYQKLRAKFEELKKEIVPADYALSVTEPGIQAPPTFVFSRGNAHVPGAQVEPAFPAVFKSPLPTVPTPPSGAKTSGRRTIVANWIASPENRLTARVMVNRVWQHHFGRGIVRSPNNFGQLGDPPTHPELLDWLAGEFVKGGWRLKPLHKLIVMSSTYRMSSRGDAAGLAKDPANDLFWRFDMRRLSAEEIRDSIHAVTARLNDKMYGPGIYPEISGEVLAGQSMPGNGWGKSTLEEQARRSVYIHVKRSLITPILADFDFADTDSSCAARFATTQPTQALGMLNGKFLNDQAGELAERLRREVPGDGPDVAAARVKLALRLVAGREPDDMRVARGVKLIESLSSGDAARTETALKMFCLMALNLNEFVYLD